jgi:hypothetical protein
VALQRACCSGVSRWQVNQDEKSVITRPSASRFPRSAAEASITPPCPAPPPRSVSTCSRADKTPELMSLSGCGSEGCRRVVLRAACTHDCATMQHNLTACRTGMQAAGTSSWRVHQGVCEG